MSSNWNRNRNALNQNRIHTINQLNHIRNNRPESPPTPTPSFAPPSSTSFSSSSTNTSSNNLRSSGGGGGGGGGVSNITPYSSSPRTNSAGNRLRDDVREYDVGDVHVRTTTRATPNGFAQSVERTSHDGSVQSSYTTQVTSFSSNGGHSTGRSTTTSSSSTTSSRSSTRVAGLSSSTHYRPQFQVSQSSALNRPGSFMDSNFRNYYDHPALNPYYRSPIGELSSINGQRRTYIEEIPDGEQQEEEEDDEEEYEDMDETIEQSFHAPRNRLQQQQQPNYMNIGIDDDNIMDEEEQIREAIRRSQEQSQPPTSSRSPPTSSQKPNKSFEMDEEDMELQRALSESMREFQQKTNTSNNNTPSSSLSSSRGIGGSGGIQRQQQPPVADEDGELENQHALEAMYNDPELRRYLSPEEQKRLERKRLIDESRRIREQQENEFNESLRKDAEKKAQEEQKKAAEEEKKVLDEAIKLSIKLEKQGRIEEIKKRLTPDPSTLPAEDIKGKEKEICEISVNLPPDGKRITRKFFTSNTLQNIRDWLDVYLDETFNVITSEETKESETDEEEKEKESENKVKEEHQQMSAEKVPEDGEDVDKREKRYISKDYQLLTTYPKQVLSDNQKTLLDLQLYPRCLLQLNNP